jgi:response regulator of citrate/malate metabolism
MKKYIETQNLIEKADRLIRLKATGTADEFAVKLGISKRSVFRLLRYFRDTEKPVKYCRYRRAYYYE